MTDADLPIVADEVLVPEVVGVDTRTRRAKAAAAPRAALRALLDLYDRALDMVLSTPHRVATASDAKTLLATDPGATTDALVGRIQQVALVVAPLVRRLGRASRKVPGGRKLPWVAIGTTAASVATSLRQGVREVQVVGSYLATRIEDATGAPANPALVKALTAQLYLAPDRIPEARERPPMARLLGRWLVAGVLGAESVKMAHHAIDAVERLDVKNLPKP
ncbi:MAG TPA: hypothetical protein VF855_06215 [Acidimicrobiales bacterium]